MFNERVQYQGKAIVLVFLELNFRNSISQNTGKYKLGRFSLKQSHMITNLITNCKCFKFCHVHTYVHIDITHQW